MLKPLALAFSAVFSLIALPAFAQSSETQNGQEASAGRIEHHSDAAPAASAKPGSVDMKIDGAARTQGAKDAPAIVAAAGVPCTVTDGYFLGAGDAKDDAGKPIKVKTYEAACKEGLGYVFVVPAAGPTKHYDCISLLESPSVRCRLPANLDTKTQLNPLVAQTGRTCVIDKARGLGATAKGDTFYEVGCQGSTGFIVEAHAAAAPEAIDCARTQGTNLECKLTTPEQFKAIDLAVIQRLVSQSGKTCQIADTRTIGALTSGATAYEVKCAAGDGYVVMAKQDGAFSQAIGCANASTIAGGCTLTNAVEAQTGEVRTYTRLAKAANFNCEVSKYNFLGLDPSKSEVVELACSNRPDGAIAFFPSDNSPGHVLDCVKAGLIHQTCHLSDTTMFNDRYTQALASKGKSSCKVSSVRGIATATDGSDYYETACSDGLPGWVIKMSSAGVVADVLTCGQARSAGLQCTLPGNEKR